MIFVIILIVSLSENRTEVGKLAEKKGTYNILTGWRDFRFKLFMEGIFLGLLVGITVVVFRVLIEQAELYRQKLYVLLRIDGAWAIALWFIALIVIGLILGFIVKKEPMSSGSGIPQVKGILIGKQKMNWLRVLVSKFIGGVLAIGAGLSLGREGPSVQLGAAIAQGMSRMLGRLRIEEKYLMTSGASAGLAAAFNAPLAGAIFALEELHKNFSPVVLTSAVAASLTADVVTQEFFGQKPIFSFHQLPTFPLHYYLYLLLMGLIIGAFGAVFNSSLVGTLNLYDRLKWLPGYLKPVIPLIIGGFLGFVLPESLGGGNKLIDALGQGHYGLMVLIILVAVKFLFTMACYGSGVPGGIFLPLLVIGALAGDIYGTLVAAYLHVNPYYVNNFIVFAMAAYFSAIVKAPVTGSILIMEMTGSFEHLLALITVSMTAYVASDIFKAEPIYDVLLERSFKNKKAECEDGAQKSIMEVPVCLGAEISGKKIKNIIWPPRCLVVGIKRGAQEIIPKGDTEICAGDYLIVLTDECQTASTREALLTLTGECEVHR